MRKRRTIFVTQAAMIAAIYVVLTVLFAPLSYGAIQVRISEALAVLPYCMPSAVPGVFAGCFLANLLTGAPTPDVIFGSLATLIGVLGTYFLRRKSIYLAPIPTILSNGIIIPLVLKYAYGVKLPLGYMIATVGAGEIISCGILGILLVKIIKKHRKYLF